jgi:hypothetical protein
MVHQYDYREKQSSFTQQYLDTMEAVKDPVIQANIQNELLGNNNKTIYPSVNKSALNPNQKFVEEYEKRQIKKREEEAKRAKFDELNERGEKYASIWNNKDFRKVHDPLGKK